MRFNRVFLLILDSVGVGEADDASIFADQGSNTLKHILDTSSPFIPNLKNIGLVDTINQDDFDSEAYYGIAKPKYMGKDDINGHYEIIGIINDVAYDTFNNGFPFDLLNLIEKVTNRHVLGNVMSNDSLALINELGERQQNYGSIIVYTSSDSDIQLAAHEESVPIEKLNDYCKKLKMVLDSSNYHISKVISRPFNGTVGNYKLIDSASQSFTSTIDKKNLLTNLSDNKYEVIGIGKINEIVNGVGITKKLAAKDNSENINKLLSIMDKKFNGLCISTLSDFDYYGHTRNADGFAQCLEEFDVELTMILNKLELNDLLIITSDHGNDPTFKGTEHTRENLPVILYSRQFQEPKRIPVLNSLADIAASIEDNFNLDKISQGNSFLDILK